MAFDPIVIGCDWSASLTVKPSDGKVDDDVVSELTGATAVAALYQGGTTTLIVPVTVDTIDAAARRIDLSLADSATAGLVAARGLVLDVRVTTASGDLRPVTVFNQISVRNLTDPAQG